MQKVGRESQVRLVEITADTVKRICALSVSDPQKKFVAPNAVSIAQAHFSEHAWFRAIYAGETPVGFVMLAEMPQKPKYCLWRLMIDAKFQGLGFGRRAMARVIEHVRQCPNATVLFTSVVQAEGGPQGFYETLGFRLTGDYDDGEAVMSLDLSQWTAGKAPGSTD
jgi:diamine N-acetyltransferase